MDETRIEHASEDDALDGANRFGGNDAHPNSLARQITARREAEGAIAVREAGETVIAAWDP